MNDSDILKISIDKLTEKFNDFIGECIDKNGKPKAPSNRALAIARACLPSIFSNSHNKKEIEK